MFRVIALVMTVFLVSFTYLFSNATYEQQQKLPAPIRKIATDIVIVIADAVNLANESVGARLRQGIRRAGSELSAVSGYGEQPIEGGLLAMNQDLTGHDFTARLIPNSTFTRARLDGANFTKTYLDNSAVDSASLTNAKFNQTIMTGCSAKGADFSGANFNDADLTGAVAQGAIFTGANFNITLMSSSQFSGANFSRSNIAGSYGDQSIFFAANFTDVNISGSDFTGATFDKASFRNAVLFETHLERASFIYADISGADFSMATGLTQAQLKKTCGDEMTRLPEGLSILTCDELNARKSAAVQKTEQANESQSDNADHHQP